MSDMLMFFGAPPGAGYEEPDRSGKGDNVFFSPAAVEKAVRLELLAAAQMSWHELATCVQRHTGLLFSVRTHHGGADVHAVVHLEDPPSHVLRVGSGLPRFEALSPQFDLQLGRGERLIVPVNAAQGEALSRLKDLLDGLPEDVAFTAWSAIGRPALAARLDRIESLLERAGQGDRSAGDAPPVAPNGAADVEKPPRSPSPRRLVLGLAASLGLAVSAAVGAGVGASFAQPVHPRPPEPASTATPAPTPAPTPSAAAPPHDGGPPRWAGDDLKWEYDALHQQLRDSKSSEVAKAIGSLPRKETLSGRWAPSHGCALDAFIAFSWKEPKWASACPSGYVLSSGAMERYSALRAAVRCFGEGTASRDTCNVDAKKEEALRQMAELHEAVRQRLPKQEQSPPRMSTPASSDAGTSGPADAGALSQPDAGQPKQR